MILRHRNGAVVTEKIGRLQQIDVQRVALDPLTAVDEPSQVAQRPLNAQAENLLQRVNRAHLVRDRTDAANARDNVRHFFVMSSLQESFEEPRRLKNP